MASVPDNIEHKHHKLLVDLAEMMDSEAPSYKNFIRILYAKLPSGRLQGIRKDPLEVFRLMEEKGILKVGDYRALEEALDASGNRQALDLVKNRGSDINIHIKELGSIKIATQGTSITSGGSPSGKRKQIGTSAGGDGSPCNKKRKIATQGTSTSSGGSPSAKNKDIATQGTSTSSGGSPSSKYKQFAIQGPSTPGGSSQSKKKRKTECTDGGESSKGISDVYGRNDKKGYLLILNFTEDRNDTELDVKKLNHFFGETLGFDVHDPRKDRDTDLRLSELNKELQDARDHLNTYWKQYYCFFCAILSHGNKKGIVCRDRKHKPIDDIRKTFTNAEMPMFAGKPKVFLIQSCRGDDTQQGHDVADDWPQDISDVAGKMSVPTDADVLIAYATTPGNSAFRRENIGSWFIQVTMDVFEKRHNDDHVEEMFIMVKNIIAKDENWRTKDNELMMPCTWSTLTQKLMI